MIAIINYGSGNINAISNLLQKQNIKFVVTNKLSDIDKADSLILPGVGAFDATMELLHDTGMYDILNEQVLVKKKNILGVCVGMQVMADSSEEGSMPGFGWIPGTVKKIKIKDFQKPTLPHMGWNSLSADKNHFLLSNIDFKLGFYYLHSFYFDVENSNHVLATCKYFHEFPCIVNNSNIYGVQFHPEKSHMNGINLFKNFGNQ